MEENLKQKQTNILRITTYGPESTGKTTLARDLANYFNTVWIVEFARDFLQEILDKEGRICEEKDLLPIAIGQTKIENEAINRATKYLFCDTNALVTKVYSDIYYNQCGAEIEEAAREHHYDLYFLTDKDVPWEDDGLRDSQEYRDSSFEIFKQNLIKYNKPFIQISGSKQERLEKASKIVIDLEKALQLGLSSHDFVALYNQKKNFNLIFQQIDALQNGISKIQIEKPAILKDGIFSFSTSELEILNQYYTTQSNKISIEKFVPSSGAASRMFKFLSEFLSEFDAKTESINSYLNRSQNYALSTFLVGLEKFPFYQEVMNFLTNTNADFENLSKDQRDYFFIQTILTDAQFNYLKKPKAVLPFHLYQTQSVSPIEEHLKEAIEYASTNNQSNIHFTVSEEHLDFFNNILEQRKEIIEKENNISFNILFSFQNQTTDSVSLNEQGEIIYENNQIVFRPGGHGALLYNLNDSKADLIFIKNIDNVSHNNLKEIGFYKKGLAGLLLKTQGQVFDYLKKLDSEVITPDLITEISSFLHHELFVQLPNDFEFYKEHIQTTHLKKLLNRPIRVCGMVKNENEPGGGPFWIREKNGNISLQIVESAQIDLSSEQQKALFEKATHFNPVDLVCGIKNYKGEKFNLLEFTNPETGFVVEKSKNGIAYKAYELPGLWNGSMANWNTIFVEVPLSTFNPVKTVNDLLKPSHQPN